MKIKSVSPTKLRRATSRSQAVPPAKRYYVLLKGSKQGHLIDAYSGYDEGKIRIVKKKKGRVKAETVERTVKSVESKPIEPRPEPSRAAEISLKEYVATEALPVVKEAVTEVKKEVEEKVREREERESKAREEKEKEEKVKKEKKDKEEYEARQDALEEYLDED